MAGSGKAVSIIVGFPTFTGAYWRETCGTIVSKIVPVNTYNYKNIFSIVLFTLVDANYNIVCECGMSGKSFWQWGFLEHWAV